MTSDLKALAIIYGLKQANANYPCIFCHNHKKSFSDIEKKDFIINRKIADSIIFSKMKKISDSKGYSKTPLLQNIDFDFVVVDMLHLFLRISEKIFKSLIVLLNKIDNSESTNLDLRPNFKSLAYFIKNKCRITNPFYIAKKNSNLDSIKFRSFSSNEWSIIFKNLIKIDKLNENLGELSQVEIIRNISNPSFDIRSSKNDFFLNFFSNFEDKINLNSLKSKNKITPSTQTMTNFLNQEVLLQLVIILMKKLL